MGKPEWCDISKGWVDAIDGFAIPLDAVRGNVGPWWYVDAHNETWKLDRDTADGEWSTNDGCGNGTLISDDADGNAAAYDMPVVTPKCDCGAIKARTTHTAWCSTQGGHP